MKERAFPRRTINIQADFIFNKVSYTGTVTNLSEKGIYINTKIRLPFRSKLKVYTPFKPIFDIFIPCNGNILKIPLKVRRLVQTDGFYHGIGADLQNPPQDYFTFFNSL